MLASRPCQGNDLTSMKNLRNLLGAIAVRRPQGVPEDKGQHHAKKDPAQWAALGPHRCLHAASRAVRVVATVPAHGLGHGGLSQKS